MDFGRWDTLFNFLVLFFWFGIWNSGERNTFFNPFLAPLAKGLNWTVKFLAPVFPGLSPRAVFSVALVVLLAMRGLAAPQNGVWILGIGFERANVDTNAMGYCLAFSALSFGIFVFKLWGLSLIYVRTAHGASATHTTGALYALARPFSDIRPEHRPWVLWLSGTVLALLLHRAGAIGPPVCGSLVMRAAISALAGWVNVLAVIQGLVILLIIGSWVSMFTGSHVLMFMCREWLDLLLGPLRRHPVRLGMLDLSPLVFLLLIGFVHVALMLVLRYSYNLLV